MLDRAGFRWFTNDVLISQKQVFAWASALALALVLLALPAHALAQAADAGDDHQPATRLSGYMDFHYTKSELAHGLSLIHI